MFREMRRFKQSLPQSECEEILLQEKRGVLSLIGDDGYPYGVPIDFLYEASERKIYFHSARLGHKVDAMNRCEKVCFTVFEKGEQREDWSYYVRSVIAFGRVKEVVDEDRKFAKCKAFAMKYYPSEAEVDEEMRRDFARVAIFEIEVEHLSGKIVHEK